MQYLRDSCAKRWLRRRDIKLSQGLRTIPRNAQLALEERTAINVDTMLFSVLEVGAMTYIRSGSQLRNVCQIGRFCSISNQVVVGHERGGRSHCLSGVTTSPFFLETPGADEMEWSMSATKIGHDVWIGRDAVVMEGVSVGTGAVIGSRSVVTKDVPPYAIVAGNPARLVRYRLPLEIITPLLESRWWEIDLADLRDLPFAKPQDFLASIECRSFRQACYRRCLLTRHSWSELT